MMALLLIATLLPSIAFATPTEEAIKRVVVGIPELQIERAKSLSDEYVGELAAAIDEAAAAHDVDPFLLVAIAYREGSFRMDSQGKLGELSTFQIMPVNARRVATGNGFVQDTQCSLDTAKGAARCAAAMLRTYVEECGTMDAAMVRYASGRSCSFRSKKIDWIVRDRMRIADVLRGGK